MRARFWLPVLVLAMLACASPGGDVDPNPRPQPTKVAPDPNPVGSAGRDRKSVQLYASWEHEYEKIIGYQDGTLTAEGKPRHELNQRAQTPAGGSVSIAATFKPNTVYSISVDRKNDREDRGITTCWILWDNKIQDRDTKDDGSGECTWRSP